MSLRWILLAALGLALGATAPARAECFSGCGYGMIIAIAVGIVLAIVALVIFVMVKLGVGWLIKWLVGAGILLAVVPPLVTTALHARKLARIDALDLAGPLPRMAERMPLFVLYSAESQGCTPALDRYLAAQSPHGVLVLETWSNEEPVDFSRPVELSRLPLMRKLTSLTTVTNDPNVAGSYQIQETATKPLTPEERKVAAAEVDYLVFAQCYGSGAVFEAFRQNPALQGTEEPFHVELAMAPLAKGSGVLSVSELTFDLLDLRFDGVTRGDVFRGPLRGGAHRSPIDPAALEAAFCGAEPADCAP